ncbi:hypothetical protein K440DRAFT_661540 [Wilcoxina mikolae CBS 423.85]|nr:hypothetical protein K440DRAFT_661540 [Wilcoxina mikolae CBS 423.85]
MFERHRFYATETQYKKRISRVWNIQKNVPTDKMKKIIRIVDKRLDVEGKQTAVAWHGKPLNPDKIDRSKKRFEKTGRCRNSGSHVETPSSVTYWTPKLFTPVVAHDFASPCVSIPPVPHWLGSATDGDDIGFWSEKDIDIFLFGTSHLEYEHQRNTTPGDLESTAPPSHDAADPHIELLDAGRWDELFEPLQTEQGIAIPSLSGNQPHHNPLRQADIGWEAVCYPHQKQPRSRNHHRRSTRVF